MREGFLRIGEVSRRTGVPPEVLRAWEARYGLLRPDRSPGGFRPDVCVVSATLPRPLEGSEKRLRTLAKSTTLTLAGPGADAEFARGVGATWLDGGPVEAAAQLG